MGRLRIAIIVGIVLIIVLALAAFIAYSDSLPRSGNNHILLQSFSLCAGNCGYASPYISGNVLVNTSVPLFSLRLIINGTNEFYSNFEDYGIGNYTVPFHASGYNQSIAIQSGKKYLLTFIATFQDNSTLTASTLLVADTV